MKLGILFTLIIIGIAACAPAGRSNAGFKADMLQFLNEQGLASDDLKCSMLGNGVNVGPEAYCLVTLSESDVNNLVSQLGLRPKTDIAVSWQPTGADCWTRLDFHDPAESQWYITPDDAQPIKVGTGAEFTYFRLFYKQDSLEGCISVSYPPEKRG